jgi:2-polyprenyl-6-methoxyphenol hydroxylase-like FAD-dependent oxidoreductase
MASWKDQQVLIVGGGIGGLAAALALARQGIPSQVIEQAAAFKEIGAGIQLGPNVFRMFERLGLTAPISALAVFPENLIMFDSVTGEEVTRIPLDDAFRNKFHYPYALIHRADLHNVLLEQCRNSNLIKLEAAQKIVDIDDSDSGIMAKAVSGKAYRGAALIGADGLWSTIREIVVGDGKPKPAGHITYRAVLPTSDSGPVPPARHGHLGRREGAFRTLSAAHRRALQSRRGISFQPLRGRLGFLRRSGRAARALCANLRAGARASRQDRKLAHVGVVRPAADQGLKPRPHHASGRRRASDAAISRARRLHGGRGRGLPRR